MSKHARNRRRRAKTTVDFATGEVHDRSLEEAGNARALARAQGEIGDKAEAGETAPEQLSNEARAELGIDQPERGRRARSATQRNRRRWVKARKVP